MTIAQGFEQPAHDGRGRLYDADGNLIRDEARARWATLSPLARAYGSMWDMLRADTDGNLVELFRADRGLVEEAGNEWFETFPEYEANPPQHGEATP